MDYRIDCGVMVYGGFGSMAGKFGVCLEDWGVEIGF